MVWPSSPPKSLKSTKWDPCKSGLPDNLFNISSDHNVITIDPGNEEKFRLFWESGDSQHYYMDLSWTGEKFNQIDGSVTIYKQSHEPAFFLLQVTVSIHPDDEAWTGELTSAHGGGEGNTGVFIARQEDPPCEPEEESCRSTGTETSTTV